MNRMMNILVVLFIIFALTSFGFAAPTSTGGSGGGSSSSFQADMHISSEISQSLSLEGFQADLWAGNEDKWTHSFTDDEGNIYSHIHPQQARGSFNFSLAQGFMNSYFLPASPRIEINRWDNMGNFSVNATFSFVMTNTLVNWTQPPGVSQNWNFGGLNYGADISLRHETIWQENGSSTTPDIEGSASFWFENSTLDWANFNTNDYTYWWNNDKLGGMQLNVHFDGTYLGNESQLQLFNSVVPMPEPMTLSLVAIGSIFALRRRR